MVKNKTILIASNIITAIITSLLCFLILKYVSPTGDEFVDFICDGGSLMLFILISIVLAVITGLIVSLIFSKFSKN